MRFDARDLMLTRLPINTDAEMSSLADAEDLSLINGIKADCKIAFLSPAIDIDPCKILNQKTANPCTPGGSDSKICQSDHPATACDQKLSLCQLPSNCGGGKDKDTQCGSLTDHCFETCWKGKTCGPKTCLQHTNCLEEGRTYCMGAKSEWCKDQRSRRYCEPNGSKCGAKGDSHYPYKPVDKPKQGDFSLNGYSKLEQMKIQLQQRLATPTSTSSEREIG